jgi:DNA-binding NtrC family response regulator
MESAIQAMKFGSYDYLQKPFKLDHLKLIIDRIVEEKKIKDKAQLISKISKERHQYGKLVGLLPQDARNLRGDRHHQHREPHGARSRGKAERARN